VQGLADAFLLMDVAFHSDRALELNRLIFETMYHAAMEASVELARVNGRYESFDGSPLSKGQFQFDLWKVTPSNRYDWEELRRAVMEHGARNSLLLAPMPTASTSQILGNNECFEPITNNIYTRRTNAGEFIVVNNYLVKELIELGKWDVKVKDSIIANHGSVQHLDLSPHMKNKYRMVWEIPMRHLIDMARDRGAFICQSQSLNLFVDDPNYSRLTSMHFYAWKQGLKTGLYYLRRKPRYQPQQVTLEPCLTCSA
jgi:ribonucleoside-diphosphate reductase alpha chain